ncbi:TlpA family protein disulfide reductase [Sphingobacterium corticibacterium]|nr:thioredoxin domain-containing protein [Sphingobacterium corticibacterium]
MATKNKGILSYGFLCFMLFNLSTAWAQPPENGEAAERQMEVLENPISSDTSKRLLLNLEDAVLKKDWSKFERSVKKKNPEVDFKQFPFIKYEIDTTQIGYIFKGEQIPDEILDMPLWVLNHPSGKKTTTLRELSDKKFLVLDFWARWCSPCVASMNKWEEILPRVQDHIRVVGVHVAADHEASLTIKQRNWQTVQILGAEAFILSRYFTRWSFVGPSAWIRDGKLFGISSAGLKSYDFIFQLANGEIDALPQEAEWSHSR